MIARLLLVWVCWIGPFIPPYQQYQQYLQHRQWQTQQRANQHARYQWKRETLRAQIEAKRSYVDPGDALLDAFRKDTKHLFDRDKLHKKPEFK
jgi:hypothetical protein